VLFFFFVVVLPLLIFAVAWNQCFWTNFINTINVVLCSAIAFNYAQPLANMISNTGAAGESWSAFTEFACMWIVFTIMVVISKVICNMLSKYPVRFGKKLDQTFDWAGSAMVMIVTYGWICFSLFGSPVGDQGFSQMMQGGVPSTVGQVYGQVVFDLPSSLGMGGRPFKTSEWAKARLRRAAEEEKRQ